MKLSKAILTSLGIAIIYFYIYLYIDPYLGFIFYTGTIAWAGYDAVSIKLDKYKLHGITTPLCTVIGCLLLWVVAFPWYLINKGKILRGEAELIPPPTPASEASSTVPTVCQSSNNTLTQFDTQNQHKEKDILQSAGKLLKFAIVYFLLAWGLTYSLQIMFNGYCYEDGLVVAKRVVEDCVFLLIMFFLLWALMALFYLVIIRIVAVFHPVVNIVNRLEKKSVNIVNRLKKQSAGKLLKFAIVYVVLAWGLKYSLLKLYGYGCVGGSDVVEGCVRLLIMFFWVSGVMAFVMALFYLVKICIDAVFHLLKKLLVG